VFFHSFGADGVLLVSAHVPQPREPRKKLNDSSVVFVLLSPSAMELTLGPRSEER
jgi:hypothetical protein